MTIFSAIVGLIRAIPLIDGWVQQLIAYYMMTQKAENLSAIIDAASYAARAKDDEERFLAAERWRQALSRTRTES